MKISMLHLPRRSGAVLAIILLVLLQLYFYLPALRGTELVGGDMIGHLADVTQLARSLRAFDFGLFNPSANLGYAAAYYYQLLPHLAPVALHFLTFGLVDLGFAFRLFAILPLALLPATVFGALVIAGVGCRPAVGAAVAVGFVFSGLRWGLGPESALLTGLYAQPWGVLFLPLATAACYRYMCDGRKLARAVGLTALTGLCHPFLGICILPALLVTPWWRAGLFAPMRRALLVGGLALAASAWQFVPAIVHADYYSGFLRLPDEVGMPLADLVHFLTSGTALDAGRLPLLTALALVAILLAIRRSAVAVLIGEATMFGGLVVLGGTLGRVPWGIIPGIRFVAPMQLALAAAAGMATWELFALPVTLAGRVSKRAARLDPIVPIAALGILTVALAWTSRPAFARMITPPSDYEGRVRAQVLRATHAMKERGPGRVLTIKPFCICGPWWWHLPYIEAGVPSLVGLAGPAAHASPNTMLLYDAAASARVARLFDVRYVVATHGHEPRWPGAQQLLTLKDFTVTEIPSVGLIEPVRIAGSVSTARDGRTTATASWLQSDGPVQDWLEIGGSGVSGAAPPDATVLSSAEGPSRFRAEVEVRGAQPSTFVVKYTFHPGWHATIDGEPVTLRRLVPSVIGIDVPPGRHELRLVFRRPWWIWALMLTSVGVIVGLFVLERRANATSP